MFINELIGLTDKEIVTKLSVAIGEKPLDITGLHVTFFNGSNGILEYSFRSGELTRRLATIEEYYKLCRIPKGELQGAYRDYKRHNKALEIPQGLKEI